MILYHCYSLSCKTVNTRENFWNVYFRDQSDARWNRKRLRTNHNRDQSQLDTKQWAGPSFCEKSSIFPFYLSEKAIFYHKPTLVTWFRLFKYHTTELTLKWVQIVKNSRYRFAPRVKVFQLQKKWIENHLSQPTSTTFWTASETNREEYCLWLAHFFSLSDTLSSCVWSTDPVFLIQHRFSVKCPSYLFFGITKPKSRKRNFSIWKMVKLKLSCRRN